MGFAEGRRRAGAASIGRAAKTGEMFPNYAGRGTP